MSVEALTWAFSQEQVSPCPRFVLVALANRANEEGGDLFPSLRWIKKKTGFSERAIRNYIAELQRLGLLLKTERRRDDGARTSNEYQLPLNQPGLRFDTPQALGAGGLAGGSVAAEQNAGEGRHPMPGAQAPRAGQYTKDEKKESSKPLCPLNADLFEKAMLQLPKREGNNPARDAIAAWNSRVRSKVDPVAMVDGARRYRAYCEAKGIVGTDKVQMAKTFFGPGKPFEQDWAVAAAQKKTGAPWFRSASGINEKGVARGFEVPADPRAWQEFKTKVYEAEGVTPEMLRTAQVDHA